MRLHRRSDLSAAEASLFDAALSRLAAMPADPDDRIRAFLSPQKPTHIGRAPGRLDVMGGIADYSGGLVLEMPLDRATFAFVQRPPSMQCEIATRRDGAWQFFAIELTRLLSRDLRDPASLADWFAKGNPADAWAAYVVGVVQLCAERADVTALVRGGFRILIDSSVPEGKGVSSSAALEVAAMSAVAAALDVPMGASDIATACQWVENHIVGAPCGIMDQMTSACGRRDRLLRLRCQPAVADGFVSVPSGYRFFGIDSGVKHAVSGSAYGRVRTAAFMGYRIIAERAGLKSSVDAHGRAHVEDARWRGYLANIPLADFARFESELPAGMMGSDFLASYGGTTDNATRVRPDERYPVRAATAHPVNEQDRVDRFARMLPDLSRADVTRALGQLMLDSHASYTACGLGSPETDRLVEMVRDAGPERGLFGAKITGGGSGGTVAIFGRADAEPVVRDLAARYAAETGLSAELFLDSGPGAEETGVLLLDSHDA